MTTGSEMSAHPVFSRGENVPVHVDCDECPVRPPGEGEQACSDCIVAYLLGRDEDDAVVHDIFEERALRLLMGAGLVQEVVGRLEAVEADRRYATA